MSLNIESTKLVAMPAKAFYEEIKFLVCVPLAAKNFLERQANYVGQRAVYYFAVAFVKKKLNGLVVLPQFSLRIIRMALLHIDNAPSANTERSV